MAEYIEREAVKEAAWEGFINRLVEDQGMYGYLVSLVNEVFDAIPAADVRPVVRGRWKPQDLTWGRSYYYCSACEETVDMPTAMGIPMFRFCPNCGADMRET